MTAVRQGIWALTFFLGAILLMLIGVLALIGYAIGLIIRSL